MLDYSFNRVLSLMFWFAFVSLFSIIIASNEWIGLSVIFAFLLSIIYLYLAIKFTFIPFKSIIIISFFAIGLTRYISAPIGLSIDFLLVLTWISVFLTKSRKIEWKRAKKFSVLFVVIWFIYIVLQLFNPESLGTTPWFYAMRGMALYPLLFLPLVLIIFDINKDYKWFIICWFSISLLAVLKGFTQKFIGCDTYEKIWLAQGGAVTHVLFGQLRAFSFYSDAGQFGAAMAHASLSSLILMLGTKRKWLKLFLLVCTILFFWAYLISGTRGAIMVFAAGILLFFFLSKNFKLLVWGSLIFGSFYYLLAFTTIGQGTYEIRRLRTAFTEGSDNASLLVRIENQKKLKGYLADKPFGGGVGSAGDWGKRFHPDSVLANIATDSYYVRIYAETGIVGLILILIFFIYFFFMGAYKIWYIKDQIMKNKALAIYCGLIGVFVASYGNSVFSQFPTAIICYVSMAFIENIKIETNS